MVLRLSPKKFIPAIRALFKIVNEDSDMAVTLKLHLKKFIPDMPEIVLQWIEALELYKFKDLFLMELTVSVLLNDLDIRASLFPDLITHREWIIKVVEMLDKTLVNPGTRSPLFVQLYRKYSDIDIVKKIAKYSQEAELNMLVHCPNTVKKRRMMDLMYNMHQKTTEERQTLMSVSFVICI